MRYPSVRPGRPSPQPEEIELGVAVVGSTRVRVILDLEWMSLICFRVAPGEMALYVGVVTGADTETPNLRLVSEQSWRFPTPELRESLRRSALALYSQWRHADEVPA